MGRQGRNFKVSTTAGKVTVLTVVVLACSFAQAFGREDPVMTALANQVESPLTSCYQTASALQLFRWDRGRRALSSAPATPAIPAQDPNETHGTTESTPETEGFWMSPWGWLTIFILLTGVLSLILAYMFKRREKPRMNNFTDVVSMALRESKTCDEPKLSPEIATKAKKIVSLQRRWSRLSWEDEDRLSGFFELV